MAKVLHSEQMTPAFMRAVGDDIKKRFSGCSKIAVKLHFGEPGNRTALVPEQVKPFTEMLSDMGFDYFLYDSPVSYHSPRHQSDTYADAARAKGWDQLGEIRTGEEFELVEGEHMSYEVCKELSDADGVLVISHFKGHTCSGFGGAIKNLGMGAVTKRSKSAIHSGGRPVLTGECTQCGACVEACPLNSIKLTDKPEIGTCYGCSDCCMACSAGVLKPAVAYFDDLLAEGAYAAQKSFKKDYYISLAVNISKLCDCERNPGEVIAEDAGYFAGEDGVAIDKAAADLVGTDVFLKANKKGGLEHVRAAARLGMGSEEYSLLDVQLH